MFPTCSKCQETIFITGSMEKCTNTACGKIICFLCAASAFHWCPACSNPTKTLTSEAPGSQNTYGAQGGGAKGHEPPAETYVSPAKEIETHSRDQARALVRNATNISLWHYTRRGGEKAPFPIEFSDLLHLVATGGIPGYELVWSEGLSNWVTVAEMFEDCANPSGGDSIDVHLRMSRKTYNAIITTGVVIQLDSGSKSDAMEDRQEEQSGISACATADWLVTAMSCAAAADKVLTKTEVEHIAETVLRNGCTMSRKVVEEVVVTTCKAVYRQGAIESAEFLCKRLAPLKGERVCKLIVESTRELLSRDGKVSPGEEEVLALLEKRLL